MKYTIKNFVNVIFIFLLSTTFAIAQTASILPPGKTSFFDANGNPLVNGAITFYSPGTTTLKTTWQDSAQTTPNTNPVILDAAGRALIYGSGTYQQVVRDRSNNIIWNVQTASTGSSGGGTTATVGDGDSVGTVKPWAGFAAPSAYAFAYGQEFLRSSFPELFAALTSQQNVSCTLGTPVLSGLSSTEMLPINSKLESSCVSAGTTIISKTISTVTVSSNAIISTTTSVRFFPWGNGDGNSTFNTPDLRGRVLPGRDNMGGNAANRLSTTFYGVPSIAIGAAGGLDNHQLTIQEMPSHAHGVFLTDNGHAHGLQNLKTNQVQGGTSFSAYAVAGSPPGTLFADSNQTGITINNGTGTNNLTVANGGTAAHSIVQPSITINYIIKILPDTNPNSYFGVASIGGMTGVLTCGFGLTCSGNSISAVNSTLPPPTLTTLGGVFQSVVSSNLFLTGIDTTGTFTTGQVSFAGLTGFISTSQIPNNSINNNMLTPGAALSVTGNVNNAPANRTDITGITDQILRINSAGNTLGFGSINLAGSAAVGSSILPLTNGGTNSSLAASNGGIVFSNSVQMNILAGTTTARLPLLSGANTTPVWGTFTLPASVTSGGIPYFSSTSIMTSSGALTANSFITGGGAGASPNAVSIAGLVLGNGASAPSGYTGASCTNQFIRALNSLGVSTCNTVNLALDISGILPTTSLPAFTGDITNSTGLAATTISTNVVSNSKLVQSGATTFKGNPTNAVANVTDFTIQGLTARGTPDATNDKIPLYDNAAGTIKYVTPAQVASAGVAGVSSIAGNTGAFTLSYPLGNVINDLRYIGPTNNGQLTYTSTTALTFKPYNGDIIRINGSVSQIPASGIAGLGNPTNVFLNGIAGQTLAINTTYYVYAINNGGVITADFSTTGHSASATAGNVGTEIMTGSDLRSLIGMVRIGGTVVYASDAQTASWFNRRNKIVSVSSTIPSAGAAPVASNVAAFVNWGEESTLIGTSGLASNNTAGIITTVQNQIDSSNFGSATQGTVPTANGQISINSTTVGSFSEGNHNFNVTLSAPSGSAALAYSNIVQIRG